MNAYGDDSNGGGDGGSNVLNLTNASIDASFDFVSSPFRFTDPPRYYKANDPYFYEVDNIPLKQIHENCLWLKDQIMGIDTDVTGIPLSKITDLQPFVTNSDRVLYVRPGKFTARINDAYSSSPQDLWASFSEDVATIDLARSPVYTTPSIVLSNPLFQALVSSEINQLLYNNGLFDHYQHHASLFVTDPPISSASVPGGPFTLTTVLDPTFLSVGSLSLSMLPKIKSAVWQQRSNTAFEAPYLPDLQQLSVDFCRRWKGVFRTSVVNSTDQLSIIIPPFEDYDYIDKNDTYDPQVRIDLVFMYSHPVDSPASHIVKDSGGGPQQITKPTLGVVKGAGAILTPKSFQGDIAYDIINNSDFIGTPPWDSQANNPDKYYDLQQQLSEFADLSIQSPLSDQLGTNNTPFGEGRDVGNNFPSPDDLLNLAPILADNATESNLTTLGQTVLPLCYVIVKRGSPVITVDDIIDIRPFLRTAELTYNERAGVGAANPPLSLANPATGKYELYNSLESMRDFIMKYVNTIAGDITGQLDNFAVVPKPQLTSTIHTVHIDGSNYVADSNGVGFKCPLYDAKNINCNLVENWPEAFAEYSTPSAISAPADGDVTVELIPGRYSLDLDISIWDTRQHDASKTFWIEMVDADTDEKLAPAPHEQRLDGERIGEPNVSSSGSDTVHGHLSYKTIVDIDHKRTVAFTVTTSSSTSNNFGLSGGVRLKREQNIDGSEATIR